MRFPSWFSILGRLTADVVHLDFFLARGWAATPLLRIAIGALSPEALDLVFEEAIGAIAAQVRPQIKSARREETRKQMAVAGQAQSGAAAAEGARDRGNHADLALAIAVAIAVCDFTGIAGRDGL
jgi:hypothetical protein